MKRILSIGFIICLFSSCAGTARVVSERLEKDILLVTIADFDAGHPVGEGFKRLTVNIKNNSNEDIEFSAESFFEDNLGRYRMIYLPSKLHAGASRDVRIRRTFYRGEGSVSFGFTGNFWGITGFELDSGSHWRIDSSELKVRDIYMTLIFRVGDEVFSNTYQFMDYE